MQLRSLLYIIVLALPAMVQAQAKFEKEVYISKDGKELPYRILYPENYDPAKRYPLVLFLHGRGESGTDNEKQLVHGSKMFLDENNRKQFPAIVIFPQCPEYSNWSSALFDRTKTPIDIYFNYKNPPSWPLQATTELLQKMIHEKKADKNRIYVMGLSMGGMGTFEIIARNPGMFAAAVPICGGGDTTFCEKYASRLPLWIFHGAEDNVVSPDFSRSMTMTLKNLGAHVAYTEYPGVGHDSWENTFAEPNLLPWMFEQSLKRKRKNKMVAHHD